MAGSKDKVDGVEAVDLGAAHKEHNETAVSFVDAIYKAANDSSVYKGMIPHVSKQYRLDFNATGMKTKLIEPKDLDFFKVLYNTGNKITGNGEIALFWLFNCSNKNKSIAELLATAGQNKGRCKVGQSNKGIRSDLNIDDNFCEVKAYKPNAFNKLAGWARIQELKEYRSATAALFVAYNGINMGKGLAGVGELKYTAEQLATAAEDFCKLRDAIIDNDLQDIAIFGDFLKSMDTFDTHVKEAAKIAGLRQIHKEICPDPKGPTPRPTGKTIAKGLARILIKTVADRKPGPDGVIINTPPEKIGTIEYMIPKNLKVTNKIFGSPLIWEVAGGQMKINWSEFYS